MTNIPVEPGVPFQEFTVAIDDLEYGVYMRWNERRETWSMTLKDSGGNEIVTFNTLVPKSFYGKNFNHLEGFPPGVFVIADSERRYSYPTLDSLGDKHALVHLNNSDLQSYTQ